MTPLNQLLEQILQNLAPELQQRQVEWRISPLPSVEWRPLSSTSVVSKE